jgi:[lysine-biosynthesis-protein LysW]--L-2-aminoadipate ligase
MMNLARTVNNIRVVHKVGIIGAENNETNVDLVERWRSLGIDAWLLTPMEALAALTRGDVAIGRLDVLPTLDGIEDGLLELMELGALGVRVVNDARALLNTHDKLRAARRLSMLDIPHVATQHVRSIDDLELEPPIVLKPRFGSWGADVMRCNDEESVRDVFAEFATRSWFQRQGALAQPLVAPMGRDLRVIVAGGRVAGAEARVAAHGEWRTNISLGGTHLPAGAWGQPAEVAIAAAAAVGGGLVGIDLLPTSKGYVVLEINGAVEFDTAYSVDGDVYEEIASALALSRRMVAPSASS